MKKLILVTLVTISFHSLAASSFDLSRIAEVYTPVTASRAEAYEIGVQNLQTLKNQSGYQAYRKLDLFSPSLLKKSIDIKDGYVVVEEFADSDGSVKYQAKIRVKYTYQKLSKNR